MLLIRSISLAIFSLFPSVAILLKFANSTDDIAVPITAVIKLIIFEE